MHSVVREWREGDAAAIAGICGDPEVCAWDAIPWEPDAGALGAWVAQQREVHGGRRLSLAIADDDDRAVGWVGLWPMEGDGDGAELGYWIVPAARRRGLTLAAARAVARWGLDEGGYAWIRLHTGAHNAGSRRIAEQLGARQLPRPVLVPDREGREHELVGYELRS